MDLSPLLFVKDVLVAGEDGLHAKDNGSIPDKRPLFQQRRCRTL
jgi:hypothetical protein